MTELMTVSQPGAITGDVIDQDPFLVAWGVWLQGKSANTQRSYRRATEDFFAFIGKHPGDVKPIDVAKWKEELKRQGSTDSTIAQRLAALSSYYKKLCKPNGDDPLLPFNPVDGVERDDLDVSPYEHSRPITAADFRAIIGQIDEDTVIGARDRALIEFYAICAPRRSEGVQLRRRDVQVGDIVTYKSRVKGGKIRKRQIPPPVWKRITHYLVMDGRPFDDLDDDDPIFVATVDSGESLRQYYGVESPDGPTPLTGQAANQALKRYAKKAGIDPERISLHSLRHLGGLLYYQASGDVVATQQFLGHSHLNTTQIYIGHMVGEGHRHWQAMANMLGMAA